ncbi:hypothetical protein HHJ78_04420 [Mobiluncus mulieris]|uniref:Terminase n=1 Tax=Mobiluncus mulieris TaxID=2052 RepID=A0A7Y0U0N5_9ACTO|nr:terminase family protein [Mobiluncus mulieris]NMW64791.1 hypothetical protein [Mobiluncus mulieris]
MSPKFRFLPKPRYCPDPTPGFQNEGAEIARVSRILGITPQPWQRLVWNRATEYQMVGSKKVYKYAIILITVPRQAGKTTLLTPLRTHRLLSTPGLTAFMTAQNGQAARRRISKYQDLLIKSPLQGFFRVRKSNGEESVMCPSNGASLTKFAPVEGGLHGDTIGYADLDEIWKWDSATGETVMGALRPAQVTLFGQAQTFMVSTMGTLRSVFMNNLVEEGRKGIPGLAFFEWSLPDGLDIHNPSSWWQYHPALGNTIHEDAIKQDLPPAMTESEFMRAYGNRLTLTDSSLIPADDWEALIMDEGTPKPALKDCVVAFEVAPQNAATAVVAAWMSNNLKYVRVLHQAPGSAWLIDYLQMLKTRGFNRFAADDGGMNRRIFDYLPSDFDLERIGLNARRIADAELLSAAREEQTLRHDGSRPLGVSVAHAVIRETNGVPVFDRDKSSAPIPSLIAASIACYTLTRPQIPLGIQIF